MVLLAVALGAPARALEIRRLLSRETYFLDEENYRYGLDWDRDWRATPTGLRSTAGSISSDRFLFDLDMKLTADLARRFRFGYRRHLLESYLWDLDADRADLAFHASPWLLGITGMVRSDKSQNAVGALLGWEAAPHRRGELRLVWPGAYYNDKTYGQDRYCSTPLEVHLEGCWQGDRLSLSAETRWSREWRLDRGDLLERGRDGCAFWALTWRGEKARWGLDGHCRSYRHGLLREGSLGEELETLDLVKLMLQLDRPLSDRLTLTLRGGGLALSGDGWEEGEAPFSYRYHREEGLGLAELTLGLDDDQSLVTGVILGVHDLDPGESRRLEPRRGCGQCLLKLAYLRRYARRGDLALLVSYDAVGRGFGGGNLRIRIFPGALGAGPAGGSS